MVNVTAAEDQVP